MKKTVMVVIALLSVAAALFLYNEAIRGPTGPQESRLDFIRKRAGTVYVAMEHLFEVAPKDNKRAEKTVTIKMKLMVSGRASVALHRGRKVILTSGHAVSPPSKRAILALLKMFVEKYEIDQTKFRIEYKSTKIEKGGIIFRVGDTNYGGLDIKFLVYDELGQDFAILEPVNPKNFPKEYFELGSSLDLKHGDGLFMAGGVGSSPADIYLFPAIFEENREAYVGSKGKIEYGEAVMTLSGTAVAAGASGSPILKEYSGCAEKYCFLVVGIVRSIVSYVEDSRVHSHIFHAARVELVKDAFNIFSGQVEEDSAPSPPGIWDKILTWQRIHWTILASLAMFAILLMLIFKRHNTILSYLCAVVLVIMVSIFFYFGARSSLGWASKFIPDRDLLLEHAIMDSRAGKAYLIVREKTPEGFGELRFFEMAYEPGSGSAKELGERLKLLKKGKGTLLRLKRKRFRALKTPDLSEFGFQDFRHGDLPLKPDKK